MKYETELELNDEDSLSITSDIFEKRMYDVIIAVNLSHVGSLDLQKGGVVLLDGKPYLDVKIFRMSSMSNDVLRDAFVLANSIKWPNIHSLNFSETWNWLNKQKAFTLGHSN